MHLRLLALCCGVVLPFNVFAQAAAGVSDERVSLPGASGSISGVGENASVQGNQGSLSQSIALEVPEGFPGITPEISFGYSSNSGSGVLGIGWSMPSFSIERMTSKGLQKYALDDRFVADGSDELVRVSQTATSAVYRARFEGGFIRYTWTHGGTGEAGTWKGEYPDGRVAYFGGDASGSTDTLSQVRVPATAKTFRWHLKALVDQFGHEMKFAWTKDASGTPLLERIDYVFEGTTPRYSLRFSYEARPDVISDARPGFELRLTQRLKDVRLNSAGEVVRAWVLSYEADGDAGGQSRLMRVTRLGRNDVQHPVVWSFAYSQTLGGVCAAGCEKPFVREAGQVGANFRNGSATLLDINGDSLPDVLSSNPTTGAHTFFDAKLDGEGRISYATNGRASAQTANVFKLGVASVQVLDLNGDGFVDIAQASSGEVLCNDGSGDWVSSSVCASTSNLAPIGYQTEDADAAQADPKFVRFFDYDNDRRIDWLRTSTVTDSSVLVNTPAGYVDTTIESIGAVFDESTLQLADMNGDGLQDPVQLLVSGASVSVWYRLNFGRGAWGQPVTITLTGFDSTQAAFAQLQDINGDGLADVVAATGDQILLSLNRNAGRFDAARTLMSSAGFAIPTVETNTVVVFADMNGNGSDDVVYLQEDGRIQYVELFPVRPNLLSRFSNGIGGVELFSYGSSVSELARDRQANQPWTHRMPNATTVVTKVERFVTLTGSDSGGLKELTAFRYHDGFYDGVEKQFRGYAKVERELQSDMSRDAQEPGLVVQEFDVGATQPNLASELIRESIYALPGNQLLRETRNTVEICPVDGTTGAMPSVGFVCERAVDTIIVERDPSNAVTVRTERDFDGNGNVIRERELGVVHLGTPEAPRACNACVASGVYGAPCGSMCLGDERYSDTTYATSTGAWILDRPHRETVTAAIGATGAETLTFYDGAPFVGAAMVTKGSVSRVSRRLGTEFIDVERYQRDGHGNVVTELEATASVSDTTKGHKTFTYDAAGLLRTQVDVALGGSEVTSLRQTTAYELVFGQVSQTSNWVPMKGAMALSTAQLTRYRYDEHGRMVKQLEPGDTEENPSETYAWLLGDPSSRIETTENAGDGVALKSAQCFDGRGRRYQSIQRVKDGEWLTDGFVEFDARGAIVRRYDPYTVSDGACAVMPPANVPFVRFTFDPAGRLLTELDSDGAKRRMQYVPLATLRFDEIDNDSSHPFANTPLVTRVDGLERTVAIERLGAGSPAVTKVEYDVFGNVMMVRDAAGHARTQTYDSMGRLLRVDEPNAGTATFAYDAESNETLRTDGAGNQVKTEYDAISRRIAEWDGADEAGTKRTWTWDRVAGCAECTNGGGRVVKETWPGARAGGEELTGYDAESRPVFRQRVIAGKSFIMRTRYDGADRVKSRVFPGGLSIDATFDGADRVASIDGVIDSVTYDARGDLEEVGYRNGAKLKNSWDALRQLTGLQVNAKSGSALLKLSFDRLSTGLLDGIRDGALPGRVRHQVKFTQDAWERTSKAEFGDETVSWTYDEIDNVKSVTSSRGADSRAHVGGFTYDGTRTNAVVSAGGIAMAYDDAGRLESRGPVSYVRDYRGRIVAATGGKVDGEATFADDERIERKEGDSTTLYLDDDLELRDGIATLYVRFSGSRVARLESDALASTVLSDLSGDDVIDISDAWLAKNGSANASPVKALLTSAARRLLINDATWLHTDHLGSLVAATDINGELIGEQSFFPTGGVRESEGFVDEYGFTGQDVDDFTGLTHFKFRDLDVVTGRWDQPDPLFMELDEENIDELGEATTAYAYVANGFADDLDPTGLQKTKAQARALKAQRKANQKRVQTQMKNMLKGEGKTVAGFKAQNTFLKLVKKPISQAKYDRKVTNAAKARQAKIDRGIKSINGSLGVAGRAKDQLAKGLRGIDSAAANAFNLKNYNREKNRLVKNENGSGSTQMSIVKGADKGNRRWLGMKSLGLTVGIVGAIGVGGAILAGVCSEKGC